MPQDRALIDFVINNEQDIKKWLKSRPYAQGTYEDLLKESQSGDISVKRIPDKKWDSHIREAYGDEQTRPNLAAFYESGSKTINLKKSGEESLPHEAMHYFSSHRPLNDNGYGAPKNINPYIKADIAMKGWFPSFHPGGRRPHIGGKLGETSVGNWWNTNKATKGVAYSDKRGYHPQLDEHSFDLAKTFGTKSNASPDIKKKLNSIKHKLGNLFKKNQSFGESFKEARSDGLDEFEWQGKNYHTKYKEENKSEADSFLDRWKKSSKFRGSNY